MAVVLLAGASLLVRSYQRLRAVDPGFDPRGRAGRARSSSTWSSTAAGEQSRIYYADAARAAARACRACVAAGAATALPASPLGPDFERPVWPEGAPDDERCAALRLGAHGHDRLLPHAGAADRGGARLRRARLAPTAPRSVILSEGLAAPPVPGRGAVGERLVVDYSTSGTYPYEIVGVVGDVRFSGPRAEPRHEIYLPHAQRPYLVMNVAVRSSADPRLLAPAVRERAARARPGQAGPRPLRPRGPRRRDLRARPLADAGAARAFAAVAVLLALVGIHGVLSHRVRERTREIGIRIARGRERGRTCCGSIARHGLRLVAAGRRASAARSRCRSRGSWRACCSGRARSTRPRCWRSLLLPLAALVVSLHPAWRAARTSAARCCGPAERRLALLGRGEAEDERDAQALVGLLVGARARSGPSALRPGVKSGSSVEGGQVVVQDAPVDLEPQPARSSPRAGRTARRGGDRAESSKLWSPMKRVREGGVAENSCLAEVPAEARADEAAVLAVDRVVLARVGDSRRRARKLVRALLMRM